MAPKIPDPAERVEALRVQWCVGRYRYPEIDGARKVVALYPGSGWWDCPFCGRHHVGQIIDPATLADFAWVIRTTAGNQPGARQEAPS